MRPELWANTPVIPAWLLWWRVNIWTWGWIRGWRSTRVVIWIQVTTSCSEYPRRRGTWTGWLCSDVDCLMNMSFQIAYLCRVRQCVRRSKMAWITRWARLLSVCLQHASWAQAWPWLWESDNFAAVVLERLKSLWKTRLKSRKTKWKTPVGLTRVCPIWS